MPNWTGIEREDYGDEPPARKPRAVRRGADLAAAFVIIGVLCILAAFAVYMLNHPAL